MTDGLVENNLEMSKADLKGFVVEDVPILGFVVDGRKSDAHDSISSNERSEYTLFAENLEVLVTCMGFDTSVASAALSAANNDLEVAYIQLAVGNNVPDVPIDTNSGGARGANTPATTTNPMQQGEDYIEGTVFPDEVLGVAPGFSRQSSMKNDDIEGFVYK
jgi:hypothetical protein